MIIELVKRRVSMGMKFKSVRVTSCDKSVQASVLELEEYVSHMECGPGVAFASGDIGSGVAED